MRVRSLGWVAGLMATCATALPVHADASDKATDTCIQAFVDTYLPKDQQVQVRAPSAAPSPWRAYTRQYTIELSARLSRNGTELVTARCVASASGELISLEGPPGKQSYTGIADRLN